MFLYIDVQVAGNKIDDTTKSKVEKMYGPEDDSVTDDDEAPENGAPSNGAAKAPAKKAAAAAVTPSNGSTVVSADKPADAASGESGQEEAEEGEEEGTPEDGHIPWRWPKTRRWFNYPADSDSYPKYGFRSLPRDCSDYAGIIKSDTDWNALTQFFDVAYDIEKEKAHFTDVIQTTAGNQYQAGAKLFKAYFERVWKRADKHEWINTTMRELGALPFQIFDLDQRLWPPPKKVSD